MKEVFLNDKFKCPICGNEDVNSIGILNGKKYCRKCISFKTNEIIDKKSFPKDAPIFINYELSAEQQSLSNNIISNYKKGIDTLVYAVCGSGKTEISLGVIQYAIRCGEKVAFAVPRRDVVIELYDRLKTIFKNNDVIAVYGGHDSVVNGDLIVLTTHQLYRYKKFFSLIVLDEIDAFPFKNNDILKNIFFNSLDGHYVLMSATPSKDIVEYFKQQNKSILRLDVRFHRHPLPVPKVKITKSIYRYFYLFRIIKKYINEAKPIFIFCPTIEQCENVYKLIHFIYKNGSYVHSKCIDRNERIKDFKEGFYDYLVTTSVLERGVTVKNLQVIVINADHKIYDSGTLVQIAGRVGRKTDAPNGEVTFISSKLNNEINSAINSIKESNKSLQNLFSSN